MIDLHVQIPPLDKTSDIRVFLRGQPLQITVIYPWLLRIQDFFVPPRPVDLSNLQQAAVSSIRKLRESSVASMIDAINEHKRLDINVDLRAPTIFIPASAVDMKCSMLVTDLGHLRIASKIKVISIFDLL